MLDDFIKLIDFNSLGISKSHGEAISLKLWKIYTRMPNLSTALNFHNETICGLVEVATADTMSTAIASEAISEAMINFIVYHGYFA